MLRGEVFTEVVRGCRSPQGRAKSRDQCARHGSREGSRRHVRMPELSVKSRTQGTARQVLHLGAGGRWTSVNSRVA